jgi:hypothetical protein
MYWIAIDWHIIVDCWLIYGYNKTGPRSLYGGLRAAWRGDYGLSRIAIMVRESV